MINRIIKIWFSDEKLRRHQDWGQMVWIEATLAKNRRTIDFSNFCFIGVNFICRHINEITFFFQCSMQTCKKTFCDNGVRYVIFSKTSNWLFESTDLYAILNLIQVHGFNVNCACLYVVVNFPIHILSAAIKYLFYF